MAWIGVQEISGFDTFRNVDGTEPYLDWLDVEAFGCGDGSGSGTGGLESCVHVETIEGVTKMDVADCSDRLAYSCRIDSSPEVRISIKQYFAYCIIFPKKIIFSALTSGIRNIAYSRINVRETTGNYSVL